jgi:hypothetical protein
VVGLRKTVNIGASLSKVIDMGKGDRVGGAFDGSVLGESGRGVHTHRCG